MEVHVSISHLTDHATAIVVIEDGPRGTILDMDGLRAASVFAESLHVVVWHGRNLNSPAQWAARRPPPEKPLPTQLEIRQAIQSLELVAEKLVEQQRERLREQLLERLHELLAIQLSKQLRTQVKIELKIQVQTHMSMQVATQSKTPLPVLPGELPPVLSEIQLRPRRRARRAVRPGIPASSPA